MRIDVLHGHYPPEELARRQNAVLRCASAGTEINFVELDTSFYLEGTGAASAMFITPAICRAAVQAEADGADAVVPFGTLDPGVEAARHFVDIPVVGAGQAGYHLASMLGQRIAVLVYRRESIPNSTRLARANGVERSVVSYQGVGVGLEQAADRRQELRERIISLTRKAIEEFDADVMFPQGVTMIPVHFSAEEIAKEVGVPVVDALAASVSTAELLVSTGVKNSRIAYPPARSNLL